MKLFAFATLLLTATLIQAQANFPALGDVHIEGQIINGKNQKVMLANQNLGGVSNPLYIATADSLGRFSFNSSIPFQDYYFLRFDNGQILNIVLFGADSLKVFTDTRNVTKFSSIINSPHSLVMNEFLRQFYD